MIDWSNMVTDQVFYNPSPFTFFLASPVHFPPAFLHFPPLISLFQLSLFSSQFSSFLPFFFSQKNRVKNWDFSVWRHSTFSILLRLASRHDYETEFRPMRGDDSKVIGLVAQEKRSAIGHRGFDPRKKVFAVGKFWKKKAAFKVKRLARKLAEGGQSRRGDGN